MVSPSSKLVKSLIEAIGDLYPELSVKNSPGKHSQEEHTPIIYLSGSGHEVTDTNARSTERSASRSTESTSSGEGRVRARVKKEKDYTKNAKDDGKVCWAKCKDVITVKSKEIKELKKQRELLDKEISKPEFANNVINANKKRSEAERRGDAAMAARAEEERQDAGNANLEMLEQQQQLDQRIAAAEDVLKEELYEVIFINNKGTPGPEMDSAHSLGKIVDGNMDNINAATDFVGRIVTPEYLSKLTPYTIDETKEHRANVSTNYRESGPVTVMRLDPDESARDIAHEMGHVIEDQVSSIKENAIIYYKDRTSGDEVELLRDITKINYGADEVCKKDNFLDAYMGKFYGADSAKITPEHTELISMGIQMLYTEPQKLIDEDPAMFTWLVDTLRGKNKIVPRKDDDYY
jgi:hypothetical protein